MRSRFCAQPVPCLLPDSQCSGQHAEVHIPVDQNVDPKLKLPPVAPWRSRICFLFSLLIKHVEMFKAAQTLPTEKQSVAFYSIIYLQIQTPHPKQHDFTIAQHGNKTINTLFSGLDLYKTLQPA